MFLKNHKYTIILVLVVLIVVGYGGYKWYEGRMFWVKQGLASDKFPFKMYTERELVEMGRWPVESKYYTSIPTRTIPEETYVIFKQALIDWDLETAANCFIEEERAEYRDALIKAREEGRISEILGQLTEIYPRGERIVKGNNNTNMATYEFFMIENGKKVSHPIGFIKDKNGDWKMENL